MRSKIFFDLTVSGPFPIFLFASFNNSNLLSSFKNRNLSKKCERFNGILYNFLSLILEEKMLSTNLSIGVGKSRV